MKELSKVNLFIGNTASRVEFGEFERYGSGFTAKYRVWSGSDVTSLMYAGKVKFCKDVTVEYVCVDCHSLSRVKLYKHLDDMTYIECGCGERCEPTGIIAVRKEVSVT